MRQDITAVKTALSPLQKVGDELATDIGSSSFSFAGAISRLEDLLGRVEVAPANSSTTGKFEGHE